MDATLGTLLATVVSSIAGVASSAAKGRGHGARLEALEAWATDTRKLIKRLVDHTDLDGSAPASSRLSLPIPPATPSSDVTLEGLRRDLAALAARVDRLEGSSERDSREFSGFSNSISRELGEITGKVDLLLRKSR